jgi:histone H3/H4
MQSKPRSGLSKRRQQKSIPRATFVRLVKEISQRVSLTKDPLKWSQGSIDGLHEEAENYLEKHFARAGRLLDTFEQRTLNVRHFQSVGESGAVPCGEIASA